MFSPRTREWFDRALGAPTEVQRLGWDEIDRGGHVLLHAPTGSGKTLAAFLHAIDRAAREPGRGLRVLYVSPLKALAADVERNLEVPLRGLDAPLTVAMRTGDTPAKARRAFAKTPADILVTTPESLYLLLTSRAREALTTVDTVIVDEIHAIAGQKRGAHLALSLERLDARLARPAQRIGLTATARPLEEVGRFLGGAAPVKVVSARAPRPIEVTVDAPVTEIAGLLLAEIAKRRSTIVFVNSRMAAERLAAQLNERAGRELARAHHGSVAPAQRSVIEAALKAGELPVVVATSSLELGVDMGAVELVVQVGAPASVASGLQRIGRAGHSVGATSVGRIVPRSRTDLLASAVVAEEMLKGHVEETRVPRNPLDVLAQQIVATVAMDPWSRDALLALVRRAAPYSSLGEAAFDGVLDLLAGRFGPDDLRPRIERVEGTIRATRAAWRIAIANAGTIPDRGLFAVHPLGGGPRLGELDEEQVAELQPGDVFVLGSSSWRLAETSRDRVWVEPAPGESGKLPFWRGDAPARPVELGRSIAEFLSQPTGTRLSPDARSALDALLDEERSALGVLPGAGTLVLERTEDPLGESIACLLSPLGARVHEPWAMAVEARLRAQGHERVRALASDDGIVLRAPFVPPHEVTAAFRLTADEARELVLSTLGDSRLFATRFRDCASRALLIPRRLPGKRTPLWIQRQRAQDLLVVAARHAEHPITLETVRECLEEAFDMRALAKVLDSLEEGTVRLVEVATPVLSPFAASLASAGALAFLEEASAPRAERRAQALALDRRLLREILGHDELRELISPEVLSAIEEELAALPALESESTDPRDLVHRFARGRGPFTIEEARTALGFDPRGALEMLEREGFVLRGGFRPGGHGEEWIERDVLAKLRRRSLAALRKAVEPVEPAALGRFLPRWQGVPALRRGVAGVLAVVKQLEGAPLIARIVERDILPARVADYAPWMLDELSASGEVVWRGHGEGKIVLARRSELERVPGPGLSATHALAPVLRDRLARRGASFFLDLIDQESFEPVLEALWDLAWSGEVLADSFLPLRGALEKHTSTSKRARRLAARVPAPAVGRWSLAPSVKGDAVTLARASCERLLERYGLLGREVAVVEGVPGGWAGLYPVLSALEEAGRVRRGLFVKGVEGAQFAVPGAIDRLRDAAVGGAVVLAAADPANPWGAVLPGEVARKPGVRVVLVDGLLVLAHVAKGLTTFTKDPELLRRAVVALAGVVAQKRARRVEVVSVDGEPLLGSSFEELLRGAGFVSSGRGLTKEL